MTAARRGAWYYIHEMWAGLGVFLLIFLWLILDFLNGGRGLDLKRAKINACSHATDVASCIHQAAP